MSRSEESRKTRRADDTHRNEHELKSQTESAQAICMSTERTNQSTLGPQNPLQKDAHGSGSHEVRGGHEVGDTRGCHGCSTLGMGDRLCKCHLT